MMFVGSYKVYDNNGKRVVYERDQQVEFQGKLYDCLTRTQESPVQNPSFWRFTNIMPGWFGELPPALPKAGQEWTDSSGRTFKWYYDGESYQWVQT